MNRQIELEGVQCSCHGTEHNVTVDAATLRALLAEPQEPRERCVKCGYSMLVSRMYGEPGCWFCGREENDADHLECARRVREHQRQRKVQP